MSGIDEQVDVIWKDGYDQGYTEGKQDGYTAGFEDGWNDHVAAQDDPDLPS